MEEKQLNFSQPLLSVRRFPSALTSQKKKTEAIETLPPLPSYRSEMISGPITNAGSVPFVWEQIPGRPKSETSPPQVHAPATIPKLPPGRTLKHKKQISGVSNVPQGKPYGSENIIPLLEENVIKVDCSKEKLEKHSSSDSGDEAFMDALDTLSRGESSFYNCSVGGLSGMESDLKSSSNAAFSIDPKTRDFMMGRFLPAAKAMASEAPPHAPRKQPMAWEQPRQIKKAINANKHPSLRYGPNYVQDFAHKNAEEESDNESDEDENTSFNVCGFLPRFASKGSLCFLNPVSGMSQRTRVTRTIQASAFSQAGSCNESEEPARVAIYEQKNVHGFQAAEQPKDKRVSKKESHQIHGQSNFQKLEGSTLYNRLQGNHFELSECVVDEKDPPKKGPSSFKELLADHQTDSIEIESGSLATEKTVYVDTIHKMGSKKKNSTSSGMREYDNETLGKHSLVKETESLSIPCGEATLQSNVQIPVASSMLAADESNEEASSMLAADESNEEALEIEIIKDFGKGTKNYSITKVGDSVNLDFNILPGNSKHSHGSLSKLPPPPPLPKSPSDSWLCRTLPSVPSKNASLRSYLGTRAKPSSKTSSSTDPPKWENFVTAIEEAQDKHSQFVEGAFMPALTPIPET